MIASEWASAKKPPLGNTFWVRAKKVLIFGSLADRQVTHVTAAVMAAGHDPVVVAPEAWMGDGREAHAATIDSAAALYFGAQNVLDADAAWVRHVPAPYPLVDPRPELPPLDRREHYVDIMQTRERSSLALAVLDVLADKNCPVINPLTPGLGLQNKVTQLMRLASQSIPVPKTLITDDPERAREFVAQGPTIFKPVVGGAHAQVFGPEHHETLPWIRHAPVIFQRLIAGEDIRVTLMDDQVVSAVAIDKPSGVLDYREDPAYATGLGAYRTLTLPASILEAVRRARRILGLRFTGIDLRYDPAQPEAWAFLEANPSPTYLDIEYKTGHPITAALVAALVG